MREQWNRFRGWVTGRRAISEDLSEEIESHVAIEAEDYIERGMDPAQARLAARRRFGNRTIVAERAREAWGFPSLESFFSDFRYGIRAMLRSPGFSLVVMLTFALGIGVNTAIFSVVNAVLMKPLPYPAAERLVRFGEATGEAQGISVTWVNFQHWREGNRTFEEMAGFRFSEQTMTGRSEPLVTRGLVVTWPYFELLGMQPVLGRFFAASDDRPEAEATIVLNHRFWTGQLGGDPQIVGSTLTLGGKPYEVIAVAAPLWEPWRVDYYLSLGQAAANMVDRGGHGSMRALGRLRPGVTLAAAREDLDAIMSRLAEVDPGPEDDHRSFGSFLAETTTGDIRGSLLILMGAAGLVLLIASANIASLLLARNTERASELALRKAIGAGRLRLVRQLLTENIVIAAAGGLAGVVFAYWALRLLLLVAPVDIPRLAETTIDLPVLVFACGMTLLAGLVAGLAPVVVASRIDLTAALKDGSCSAGLGRQRQSFSNALVVSEVALTFVLAFGAGLLLRSLIAAQSTSPGFDFERLMSFSLQVPSAKYESPEAVRESYSRLLADLRATPGVVGASAVRCPPGAGTCGDWFYSIPGFPAPARNEVPISQFNSAAPGYFQMMKIPVRQGREFDAIDRAGGPVVAVINETLANTWWPGESPLGQRIKVGGPYIEGPLLTVIGVVGDVKQSGLDSQALPEIYLPATQQRDRVMTIVVRAAADGDGLVAAARSRVASLDQNLPLKGFTTLEQSLGAGLARRRFSTLLLTLFAGLAMLLAAVGIYGLLSYWVSSREREIAIRLALGARPSGILRWASAHALRLALIGVALGLSGGWVVASGLEDLVFGIPARNPATMIGAATAVILLAFVASAVPAWRASRVDAARRLHYA